MKTNIIVGQSGGPTAVINASLAGVLSHFRDHREQFGHIYGMKFGIQGLLEKRILSLDSFSEEPLFNNLLVQTPGATLGSCRFKLPHHHEDETLYEKIFSILRELEIGIFLYIGGNDSMDTVSKLSGYAKDRNIQDIKFVGIPKTIDNDLMGIDHTPGYGSAAKFVATVVSEIWQDIQTYNQPSVTIVEIMGRNAGWLTASAALASFCGTDAADLIYLPEVPFSYEKFLEDIRQKMTETNCVLVCVSEGIRYADGSFVSEEVIHKKKDHFGHLRMSGTAKTLESRLQEDTNYKLRSIELNVLQRCASHLSSSRDIEEARNLGGQALIYALQGYSGGMSTLQRVSSFPYLVKYDFCPVEKVANIEKKVPLEWIDTENNWVTSECIEYILPLIRGENPHIYDRGIKQMKNPLWKTKE